jgi:predicted GNAT family acetyltransferase
MGWCTTSDLDEFLKTAGDYLRARPGEGTLLLASAEELDGKAAGFGWWEAQDGTVRGAFVHAQAAALVASAAPAAGAPAAAALAAAALAAAAPASPPVPAPVLLAGGAPETAAMLAGTLARQPNSVSGVEASAAAADAFAAAWTQRTGRAARVDRQLLLFRLDQLAADTAPPEGNARLATRADRDNLVNWLTEFYLEVWQPGAEPEVAADDLLSYGGAMFWEVNGAPVSLATVSRRVAGAVRVVMVYTPPPFRRHGYAPAVVAAVSAGALDAGADEVLLVTATTNPIISVLRQRLGFQAAGERVVLSFAPAGARASSGRLFPNGHVLMFTLTPASRCAVPIVAVACTTAVTAGE